MNQEAPSFALMSFGIIAPRWILFLQLVKSRNELVIPAFRFIKPPRLRSIRAYTRFPRIRNPSKYPRTSKAIGRGTRSRESEASALDKLENSRRSARVMYIRGIPKWRRSSGGRSMYRIAALESPAASARPLSPRFCFFFSHYCVSLFSFFHSPCPSLPTRRANLLRSPSLGRPIASARSSRGASRFSRFSNENRARECVSRRFRERRGGCARGPRCVTLATPLRRIARLIVR